MQNNSTVPMDNIIGMLNAKADALFRFVMLYKDFAMEKKDYGTGEYVCMVEAHTLMEISRRPGVTVSELAVSANRSKGAISQNVKKLEQDGYIYRSYAEHDGRLARLYPTEKGLALNRAHTNYDSFEVSATFEELNKYCSMSDIDAFFRVINAYLSIFSEEHGS